jgi:hypothetical protein
MKIVPPKSKDETYRDAVTSVIRNFYFSLMDAKFLTPNELKVKWGSIWGQESLRASEVQTGMKAIKTDYERKGLSTLLSFHEWAKNNCGVPIDIDREYALKVGEHRLYGKLEIIRQKFDKSVDMLHIKTWESIPDESMIQTDLGITIDAMAFNSLYGVTMDSQTILTTKNISEIPIKRNESDFKRAAVIINNVCSAIEASIVFPRWNIYCKKCQYQDYCRAWNK